MLHIRNRTRRIRIKKVEEMIREFKISDTKQVMKLWLAGNEDAHPFIPKEYWHLHYNEVQEALLEASVFVYDSDGTIQGFIGMINEYIAGIFVDRNFRSQGIGTQLLNYVKRRYARLSLKVYIKNTKAVSFYLKENFSVSSESIDEDTGEKEYIMIWQ